MTELLDHSALQRDPAVAPAEVSIVIVSWNSADCIESCLLAVRRAMRGMAAEVVVVDNGSEDGSLDRAASAAPRDAHLVEVGENRGFASGVNRALAESRGELILLLNPDCQLEAEAIAGLAAFLDQHPKAAAAVPLLFGEDGEPQRDFQLRRLPTFGSVAAELLLIDKLIPRNRFTARYRYHELDITRPGRVEQPAAAAMMIRRSVVERIGMFDERFSPAWFEDVDYCRRLAAAGEEIWLVPSARARHRGGASLEHISFSRFSEIWYRNLYRYARKWFRPRHVETLRWLVIVGMVVRMAALSVGFSPGQVRRREAFRGYRAVMKQAFERWGETSRSS